MKGAVAMIVYRAGYRKIWRFGYRTGYTRFR